MRQIGYDAGVKLDWAGAVDALRKGHLRPKAEIGDLFLGPSRGTSLTRAAFIDGFGYGVKSVTVCTGNAARGLPTVQGAMLVFAPETGELRAVIDARLVTEFKTAADSVLGASLLARPDSRTVLIVGAGTVAASLVRAYPAIFPSLERILVWARRPAQAEEFAAEHSGNTAVEAATDLEDAARDADIISTATLSERPVLLGDVVSPGTHVDLIGAFRKDMREADDALLTKARLYVDSRDTTIGQIGEIAIPMAAGVIGEKDIRGDLYDLVAACPERAPDDVTVFKNGGGAHLDLMIADWITRSA